VSEVVREEGGKRPRRFKPYPAYKDSGVEWLGDVPVSWDVKPLKHLTAFSTGWTPPTGREDLYGGEHLWANISDLGPKILFATEKTISDAAIREARLRIVAAGSLLFSFKLTVGTVSIAGQNMYTNEAIAAFSPSERIDTRYLYWGAPLLVRRNAQENIYGAPLLNRERIANARLLSPPVSEQRAIAAFLDWETARIDALVAKKERLIELLQEKRTALITRAVTKGLDPNAPMKDSGVEWLGEIPAYWEVKPFTKYVIEKSDYRGKTPEKVTSGVFLVTAKNVRMGLIDYECSQEFVAEQDYNEIMRRGLPKKGDVLFTTEAPLGNVALVDREDIALAQRIIRFRMDVKHFESRFTLFAMMSDYFQSQLFTLSTGSTAEGLKASKLPMLRLVAPPIDEQSVIVDFLDREIARIDALVAKVRDAIARLKELRTALISAAVTGKIDVREEAA
jgi:type I restriction enzyme S subunit